MTTGDVLAQLRPRKVVVFGGNGFIGSHFVDRLVEWGHEVTVVDRFSAGRDNFNAASSRKVRTIRCDITDAEAFSGALDEGEIVYNFVSTFDPRSSWGKAIESVQTDLIQSMRLCELCVSHGIAKIVYLSSGGTVYGPQSGVTTEQCLPRPFNPHGICKLATEHFLEYYKVRDGIAADIYRIGNVFGPRQSMRAVQGVIAIWMRKILDGEPIEVYGDNETRRDYIFVRDAAYLLGHSLLDLGMSDTYNLGTGHGVSIIELLDIFKETIDMPFESRVYPRRPSDNTNAVLSGEKLCRHHPLFRFQDLKPMIKHTWDHVKSELRHGR